VLCWVSQAYPLARQSNWNFFSKSNPAVFIGLDDNLPKANDQPTIGRLLDHYAPICARHTVNEPGGAAGTLSGIVACIWRTRTIARPALQIFVS
jgi:hypothetical protein